MVTAQLSPQPPDHHIVFTIPRTASHLLLKLLNLAGQSHIHRYVNGTLTDGYIFRPAAKPRFMHSLPGKPVREWSEEQRRAQADAFQSCFNDWMRYIEEAERQGKSTLVKEHLHWVVDPLAEARFYGYERGNAISPIAFQTTWSLSRGVNAKSEHNVTCVPDAFLLQCVKPTFLIRHPALTFPSNLRTAIDGEGISNAIETERVSQWECTYHWTLSLYKFYNQATSFDRTSHLEYVEYPIVLDASDLGDQALVKKYAKAIGLDENKVQFAWQAAGEDEMSGLGKMEKRMKSTILGSSGIENEKLNAEGLNVEKLQYAWKEEFGDVLGDRLVNLVNDSMEAYETLRSVRLRV